MARTKKSTARTLLCATKFWSHCYKSGGVLDPIFADPKKPCVATSRSGVRHVVRGLRHGAWDSPGHGRNQGRFSARPPPREIDRAEKFLIKRGFLERVGTSLRVTERGRRVDCGTVDLSPWTDQGYTGSALRGRR